MRAGESSARDFDALSPRQARQVDKRCDRFEEACRAGFIPRPEDYLGRSRDPIRSILLGELRALAAAYRAGRTSDTLRSRSHLRPHSRTRTLAGHATAAEHADFERPEAPAGYEIVAKIDHGGMGVVYKARQVGADRLVALKMIRPDALDDRPEEDRRRLLERFVLEASATARLVHDHIVTVFDVGVISGGGQAEARPFYAMEYMAGPSLAEVLQDGPMKPREAAADLAALARAAHYAHSMDILHRDIKPRNILIDAHGLPHLADFGLAKRLSAATGVSLPGDRLGTPAYMSPEQFRDPAKVGVPADVYGLGSTFYDMLTGRPPFVGDPVQLMHQVLHEEPVPPRRGDPRIPRDLETICLACLSKEPKGRYGDALELALDLERFLRGVPITRRRPGLAERAVRSMIVHRTATAIALAASIAVGSLARIEHNQAANLAEQAGMHVETLRTSAYENFEAKLDGLAPHRAAVDPLLVALAADPDLPRDQQLRANLALLPTDPARVADRVREGLYDCSREAFPVAVRLLKANAPAAVRERLWADWSAVESDRHRRLRAASALAGVDPDGPWDGHAAEVVRLLMAQGPQEASATIDLLAPVGGHLLDALKEGLRASRDRNRSRIALMALTHFRSHRDWAQELILLIRGADTDQLRDVAEKLRPIDEADPVVKALRLAAVPGDVDDFEEPLRSIHARANAAVLLYLIGDPGPVLRALEERRDQGLRTAVIDRLGIAVDTEFIANFDARQLRDDLPPEVLQGLLLILGGSGPNKTLAGEEPLTRRVASIYRDSGDAGVHAAAWLLLRQWGRDAEIRACDLAETPSDSPSRGRGWFLGPEGHCFAVVRGPIGFGTSHFYSYDSLGHLNVPERTDPIQAALTQPYAVAMREVSRGQMRRFREDRARRQGRPLPAVDASPDDDLPANGLSEAELMAYCAWLDVRLGPGRRDDRPSPGFKRSQNRGFRPPTGVEWEWAVQSGHEGPRFFGRDEDLIGRYANFVGYYGGDAQAVGALWPTTLGLFDVYGNVGEYAYATSINPGNIQVCGGNAGHPKVMVVSNKFQQIAPNPRYDQPAFGLRVAITLTDP